MLLRRPSTSNLAAAYLGIAQHFELHVDVALSLQAVIQVEDETSLFALGEGVAMEGSTRSGSQFGLYAVAIEEDAIVTWSSHLRALLEGRAVGLLLAFATQALTGLLAHGRHQQYVAIVAAARSVQVGMAEAVDGAVGIVVARAGIPLVDAGIGAGLNHAVRHHGTRIGMAMASGTDKGVHIRGVIGLNRSRWRAAAKPYQQAAKGTTRLDDFFCQVFHTMMISW